MQRSESDRPFHVEQHGIDYIPDSERWAKPRDLFGLWAGASVQVEYFVYGAILMTFGFTFAQAVALIVLGNLSFLLLGLCSLQGPDAGTTVFAISRAPYGTNGSRLIALFNWLTQIGFETEGLILIVGSALVLGAKAGFDPGTPYKVVVILAAVAMQAVLPFLGHATMVKVLRYLILPFVALFVILAVIVEGHTNLNAVSHGPGWQTFMVGLAFTIALSGLGWTENGNDYSRYLPRNASKPAIVGWVFLGTAVPEILIMILGAMVGTYLTTLGTSANPFSAFVHAGAIPGGFVVVFLALAIVQLFAVNSLDLYSSGVTLQALGLRVRRYQAVFVDTLICCGITFYAIFDSSFAKLLTDFVDAVICWIAPFCAIFLVDWVLRRYRYVPADLQRTDRSSVYWRSGGVHWPGIVAQALGSFAAVMALDTSFYVSPISNATGGADFSIFMGLGVGGLSYLALAGRSVRREEKAHRALLDAAADDAEDAGAADDADDEIVRGG
ncbi:MAG: purine-cytosine permease family protein [Acidimicrobiales bacterium]